MKCVPQTYVDKPVILQALPYLQTKEYHAYRARMRDMQSNAVFTVKNVPALPVHSKLVKSRSMHNVQTSDEIELPGYEEPLDWYYWLPKLP